MSKAQYDIYMRKVYDLAHTLVIKSQASADSINKHLMALGHSVNDTDPSTWKYYLNLAGRYHATDRMMQVTSLDTLQTIDFTREKLQEHRTTFKEYGFGSRFYNSLVERYPDQELLIRGILSPVDIAEAVAAPDGRILDWSKELVEENETNLIPKLSEFCEGFMVRWNVRAFAETDDLYPAAQLAVLFAQIPVKICNLRLANCHTHYAHSFHIREYLASNGRLDVYVDHLNKRQMLWLYRNIRYLHRNAGKQETFQKLMHHVLTIRGLPLAEWSMRHNLADQVEEIYPDIEFSRRQLNLGASSAGSDTATLVELLNKEQPAAKGNKRVQADTEVHATELMENSVSNRLATKILESSVLDMTDATVYTRSDALLNHWLYLAARDQYTAIVVVENPKTGDLLTLTPKDAFVTMLYAYNKARGLTLMEIPLIEAINVRRLPVPTRAKLKGMVESRLVSDALINQALDVLTPVRSYISTIAFYEAVLEIHRVQQIHRLMYTTQEHMEARAQVEMMVSHLYADIGCDLGAGELYTSWFNERGLDIPTFSALECDLLATALLKQATGVNLKNTQSLKEMQAAMLRLMAQLSSYSVQYLQSINTDPIQVVEWPATRIGDMDVKGKDTTQIDHIDTRVQDVVFKGKATQTASLDELAPDSDIGVRQFHFDQQNPTVDTKVISRDTFYVRLPIPSIRVLDEIEEIHTVEDVVTVETEHYVPVDRLGLENAFMRLTTPQYVLTADDRATLLQRWNNYRTQIGNALQNRDLPGLNYPDAIDIAVTDLDGLKYPFELQVPNTDLDGLDYPMGEPQPPEREIIVLNGFLYPIMFGGSPEQ